MEVDDAIRLRRTHKQYGRDPVAPEVLRELLELARWAPNHHLTQPARFRLLGPEARERLEAACGDKEAVKLRRAPTLLLVTAVLTGDPSTDREDLLAVGCSIYAILLGATARGLASYWRTPAALEGASARAALGLAPDERVVGLVHLGDPISAPPVPERASLDALVTTLP